ncbi:hypothetical protein HAX54_032827 [Datura stramonium]|uniref:Uncharacterized protein n=1 Tax=Datura stramonium TaxID=4076 RepID=A0ABS8SD22_DATST|nr:hypothetical protein [Datura stramonium]
MSPTRKGLASSLLEGLLARVLKAPILPRRVARLTTSSTLCVAPIAVVPLLCVAPGRAALVPTPRRQDLCWERAALGPRRTHCRTGRSAPHAWRCAKLLLRRAVACIEGLRALRLSGSHRHGKPRAVG